MTLGGAEATALTAIDHLFWPRSYAGKVAGVTAQVFALIGLSIGASMLLDHLLERANVRFSQGILLGGAAYSSKFTEKLTACFFKHQMKGLVRSAAKDGRDRLEAKIDEELGDVAPASSSSSSESIVVESTKEFVSEAFDQEESRADYSSSEAIDIHLPKVCRGEHEPSQVEIYSIESAETESLCSTSEVPVDKSLRTCTLRGIRSALHPSSKMGKAAFTVAECIFLVSVAILINQAAARVSSRFGQKAIVITGAHLAALLESLARSLIRHKMEDGLDDLDENLRRRIQNRLEELRGAGKEQGAVEEGLTAADMVAASAQHGK